MAPDPCPDDETLAAFVEDRLQFQDAVAVAAHLADCDTCREVVAMTTEVVRPEA